MTTVAKPESTFVPNVPKPKSPAPSSPTPMNVIPLPQRLSLAAVAGMGAASFCHPFDVLRVQMQTEGKQYRNTLDAGIQIYQRSGLRNGLYAGISAAYLRQWLYTSFRIGIYSSLLDKARVDNVAKGRPRDDISFSQKLSMGGLSGAIGSFMGNPSEIALVRMSADSKAPVQDRRNYKNVFDCIYRITKEEGVTKLWRGATPTVIRAAFLASFQLSVTSELKNKLIRSGYFGVDGQWGYGIPMLFCATLASSFVGNLVANPFDVVKSRLQNMKVNPDGSVKYRGMADCFVKCVRSEGVSILFAGFTPSFVKLAPYSIISLTLVDKLTKALVGRDAL